MRLPRRNPRRPDHRVVHQVASWCLSYPDDELLGRLPMLRAALADDPASRLLQPLLDHLDTTGADELRREYLDLFDLSRRHTLYLTYWTDGDTRRRGASLGAFKQAYRDSGFLVNLRGELPDHLPIVLEFCACADPERGIQLLQQYRPALELLRRSLVKVDSDYASALEAVCSTIPGDAPSDPAAALGSQIPVETVGLEPYDPRLLPLSATSNGG